MSTPKPGIYTHVSDSDYSHWEAERASELKLMGISPAAYRHAIAHPKEQSDPMRIGSAVHCAILEPDQFGRRYAPRRKTDLRRKVDKEYLAEWTKAHPAHDPLIGPEWDAVAGMRDAVFQHPVANALLKGEGLNEVSILWNDVGTGILCKARFDRLCGHYHPPDDEQEWSAIINLKTARPPRVGEDYLHEFEGHIYRYWYHGQAAMYLDGADALVPRSRRYVFVIVENQAPYQVWVAELKSDAIEEGRISYQRYLEQLKRCRDTRDWPGYPTDVQIASLPHWAFRGDR